MTQKRLVSSNPAEAKMTRCTFASPGCASVGITANPMSSTSNTDITRDIVGFIHVFCFIAPSCTVTSALGHYPYVQEDVAPSRVHGARLPRHTLCRARQACKRLHVPACCGRHRTAAYDAPAQTPP